MIKGMIEKISVFLPCYNLEHVVEDTIRKTVKVLESRFSSWELIVIDDGSRDLTGTIADRISKENKNIKVIHHSQNRGYGAAFKSGLYSSTHPWIVLLDGDGQFSFSEIGKFIENQAQTKADVIIGYYINRQVPFRRKLNTFFWQLVVKILFGLNVRDIDCGFKLISKKVVTAIPKLESERGAFISSEFLIKARKFGFKITEVPVTHFAAQKEGTGAKLNVIIKSFIDLFKLWGKLH